MYMYIRIYIYVYIYRYLYPRKAGLVLQKSMPSMLRLTHITIPFPSMRHSLDDAGVIYIYINIMIYMFRMSGCRCSPRRPIPMPRDGDDTDQRAEPVATSVQFQGLLSVSCEDCSSFLHLEKVRRGDDIFHTRVTELDDRGTNGGQPDDDDPNPTFSEWSDKLHEAEEIVRKVKADIHRVQVSEFCWSTSPRVILDVEPREDRAKEKKDVFAISSDSDSSYT